MPALPAVPGVLRSDYFFDLGEDLHAKCREFWRYTGGPPSDANCATLATTFTTAFGAHLKSLMGVDNALTEVDITDLTSPTSGFGSSITTVTGTRSGTDVAPASAAVLESQHITRRYRGGHPRIYWPFGTADDFIDEQKWSSSLIGDVATGRTAFVTAVETSPPGMTSLVQVNVSFYEGFTVHLGTTGRARNVSTPRVAPIVDAVVSFAIQQGIAEIRKRLLKLA